MNRRRARHIQKLLFAQGYDLPVDGVWGKISQATLDAFYIENGYETKPWGYVDKNIYILLRKGLPDRRRVTVKKRARKSFRESVLQGLPHSTEFREMVDYYGHPLKDVPHLLVDVDPGFQLYYGGSPVSSVRFHERGATILGETLNEIADTFSNKEIEELEINRYSGSYNKRKVRGGTAWSTHAFGCAIDWNAWKNRMPWGRDKALFARPEYDEWRSIWRKHGFVNLGEALNIDWMHQQLASI